MREMCVLMLFGAASFLPGITRCLIISIIYRNVLWRFMQFIDCVLRVRFKTAMIARIFRLPDTRLV